VRNSERLTEKRMEILKEKLTLRATGKVRMMVRHLDLQTEKLKVTLMEKQKPKDFVTEMN